MEYFFQCKKCQKQSEPIKIGQYKRLEDNQFWFCSKKCKPSEDIKSEEEFLGGYLIKLENSDF